MIGLEGSGFTICLGVILLLTGIVMYYCKSKITQCESKINTMLNLITGLHEEINILKQQKVSSFNNSSMTNNTEHEDIEDIEDMEDIEDNEKTNKNNNSFLNHPYQELIPDQMNKDIHTINESSESEDDTSDEEQEEEIIKVPETVKVVDLGEIENLDLEEEKEDSEEETDEESEDSESSLEKTHIDYSKMQVSALKKLAAERQLAPNVHKLRKKELVTLLQA